ncbi:MAG: IS3 family transposase [Marinomonas sp.]
MKRVNTKYAPQKKLLDNAVAENFFGILKAEMFHNDVFKNADDLIEKIKEHIIITINELSRNQKA